jgi:hypothetical protein
MPSNQNTPHLLQNSARVFLHLVFLWPAALWLGWLALSQVNFFYPQDYRLLDIPATIEKYVPLNRHGKQSFIETDSKEHDRLFAAITHAINHNGQGLAQLHYFSPDGRDLGVFLTVDEVTHLTDVSKVIDRGDDIGLIALLAWLSLIGVGIWKRKPLPSFTSFAVGTLITLCTAGLVVFAIGPMQVFDSFHRSVFPANHPWFFYYQDSLMTTFMQAPNLFGLIAVWWLAVASAILLFFWIAAKGLIALRQTA